MEAKDTRMTTQEMKDAGGYDALKQVYVSAIDIFNIQRNITNHQAEVSFKAGIKEVVGWFEANKLFALVPNPQEYVIFARDWQSKLKEWGID